MQKRDLITKLKVVEGFNQLIDHRFKELDEMFEREGTQNKIITRYRKTGETAFIMHLGFPEDQKKKRKYVHS